MSNIDDRIVRMKFENDKFAKGVNDTLKDVKSLERGLQMDGIADNLDKIASRFSTMGIITTTALQSMTKAAINFGKTMVGGVLRDVKAGFAEYETQINAVQTIMANTASKGTTLDQVNEALNQLNKYADLTIYNFTEMTRNIGTFTAAGVDLDASVSAIQGIANLAAVSGSTSQQASTAMYQLSQALANGRVNLQDWNSVVNAGMGGEFFQNALKDTAKHYGTNVDAIIAKEGSFRESLTKSGWLTTEILTETLEKFTMIDDEASRARLATLGYTDAQIEEIVKMGETATDAATKVKTLTQLFDTLGEAKQSGWTQTWELLLGDFEEAKAFFTKISDTLSDRINVKSDKRNSLLSGALRGVGGETATGFLGLQEALKDTGIEADKLEEALIKVAKSHGVSIEDMIEKEGSFAATLKKGWLTGEMLSQAITSFTGDATGFSKSTEGMTDKLGEFEDVVNQVMKGNFKNGAERIKALTDAGYDYSKVQGLVNQVMAGGKLELENMSDAQLESVGYTKKQIKTMRDLAKQAKETGTPLNELIENMTKPTGRELLLESFWNLLSSGLAIMDAVKKAWSTVFPPMTSEKLYKIIEAINAFTKKLTVSDDAAEKFQRTFTGLFSILGLVKDGISFLVKGALTILNTIFGKTDDSVKKTSRSILDITANIGDSITRFREWTKEHDYLTVAVKNVADGIKKGIDIVKPAISKIVEILSEWKTTVVEVVEESNLFANILEAIQGGFENFGARLTPVVEGFKGLIDNFVEATPVYSDTTNKTERIANAFDGLRENLTKAKDAVVNLFKAIKKKLSPIFEFLKEKLSEITLDDVGSVLAGGGLLLLARSLNKALTSIDEILEGFVNILEEVGDSLKAFRMKVKAQALIKIAIALGVITLSIIALSFVKIENLAKGLLALTVTLGLLVGAFILINKNVKDVRKASTQLVAIGVSMLLLAAALAILGRQDPKTLLQGGIALGVLLGAIAAFVNLTKGGDLKKSAGGLTGFATGIVILAGALAILGNIDPDNLTQGNMALIGLLIAIGTFIDLTSGGDLKKSAGGLTGFATGIVILSGALALLGKLKPETLQQGSMALIGLMIAIGTFIDLTSGGDLKASAGGLAGFAAGIMILTGALVALSKLDENALLQGSAAIVVLLAAIATFIDITRGGDLKASAGGITGFAIGIIILSGALNILGKLDPARLIQGGVAIVSLLLAISTFINMTRGGDLATSSGGIIGFATGIIMLAGVLAILSALNMEKLAISSGIINTLILSIGAFVNLTKGSDLLASAVGLAGFALAIGMLGAGLSIMSGLKAEQISAAATAIAILLVAVGTFTNMTRGSDLNASGVGLAIFAVSVGVLAVALKQLGSLPMETLLKSIGALAVTLTILGVAATILGPITIGLIGLSAAILILGVGALAAGAGFKLLAEGMALIAAGGQPFIDALSSTIEAVLSFIPLLATKIGEGIVAIAVSIQNGSRELGEAFKTIVLTLLDVLVSLVPELANGALELIAGLLSALVEHAPEIIDSLFEFVILVFKGLTVHLPELISAVVDLLSALFSGVIDVLKGIDTTALIEAIIAIGILSGVMVALSAVAGLAPGAMLGLLGAGAIIAELALLLAAIGALAQIPGLKWLIDEGGELLKGVGTAIGSFIGGIVGGFMSGVSSSFPQIATDLSDFMTNLKPFIEGSKSIDKASMDGVSSLAKVILLLTAANILDGLTSWLTGGSSMTKFGKELAEFGPYFKAYYDSINGMKGGVVESSANAAKALASMANNLPNHGGILQKWTGDNDLAKFAEGLIPFGVALKTYSIVVTGLKASVITESATAAKSLSELEKNLPNHGGKLKEWLMGDNDLATFAKGLVPFGSALMSYASTVADLKPTVVTSSVRAAEALSGLAQGLPAQGGKWQEWFGGKSDLGKFGEQLKLLGTGLNDYYVSVKNVGVSQVNGSTTAIKNLISAVKGMDNIGKDSVSKFSKNLENIGKISMTKLTNSLGDTSGVSRAVDKIMNVITSEINADKPKVITAMKTIMLGLNQEITNANVKAKSSISSLVDGMASKIREKYETFKTVGRTLVGRFIDGFDGTNTNITSKLTKLVNDALTALRNKYPDFKSVGTAMVTQLGTGVSANLNTIKTKLVNAVTSSVSSVRNEYYKFYNAGAYLVQGFAKGISANAYRATNASRSMANAASSSARKALNERSPSKVFYEIGNFAGLGFVNAFKDNEGRASNAGTDMANSAVTGFTKAIVSIQDAIDNDMDMQPTIRPVLDLSNIQNGSNTLNSMMSRGYSTNLAFATSGDIRGTQLRKSVGETTSTLSDIQKITNNHNTFNITSNNPKEVANEVSRILQQQVERKEAAWA